MSIKHYMIKNTLTTFINGLMNGSRWFACTILWNHYLKKSNMLFISTNFKLVIKNKHPRISIESNR